jgi:hypothetical protein
MSRVHGRFDIQLSRREVGIGERQEGVEVAPVEGGR